MVTSRSGRLSIINPFETFADRSPGNTKAFWRIEVTRSRIAMAHSVLASGFHAPRRDGPDALFELIPFISADRIP